MTELHQKVCEPCRIGAPRLSLDREAQLAADLPAWQIIEINQIKRLQRVFKFENFIEAMAFANRVAELAESEGHHPALLVEWGSVTVSWWTHKIGGLHQNDAIMAAKTEQIISS